MHFFLLFQLPVASAQTNFVLQVGKNDFAGGTVTSDPLGINCGYTCSQAGYPYKVGTNVIITFTPTNNYKFVGWSGDCSGANPRCVLVMDSAKTVTANSSYINSSMQSNSSSSAVSLIPPIPTVGAINSSQPISVNNNKLSQGKDSNIYANPIILGFAIVIIISILFLIIAWFWKSRRY